MSFLSNHFSFLFSLQLGKAKKWWAMGENRWVPPFSLLQNHSKQAPFSPKISLIFSPLFFIFPIFTPTKHSLSYYPKQSKLTVRLAKIIFANLFYCWAYFCYYSWFSYSHCIFWYYSLVLLHYFNQLLPLSIVLSAKSF